MDTDPNGGFRKLTHLLQSPPFPPVTFANLLLLYCKPQRGLYDLAADVMAENPDLLAKLPQARRQMVYVLPGCQLALHMSWPGTPICRPSCPQ